MSDNDINFADLMKVAKTAGFSILDKGEYVARVKKAEATTAKSSGSPMIKLQWQVLPDYNGGKKGTVFDNMVLTRDNEMALMYFFRNMEAVGLGSKFFESNPSMEEVAQEMVDKICKISVVVDNWQGKDNNKVEGYKKFDEMKDAVRSNGSSPGDTVSVASSAPSGGISAPPDSPF